MISPHTLSLLVAVLVLLFFVAAVGGPVWLTDAASVPRSLGLWQGTPDTPEFACSDIERQFGTINYCTPLKNVRALVISALIGAVMDVTLRFDLWLTWRLHEAWNDTPNRTLVLLGALTSIYTRALL